VGDGVKVIWAAGWGFSWQAVRKRMVRMIIRVGIRPVFTNTPDSKEIWLW
jgi:hypothetical protein